MDTIIIPGLGSVPAKPAMEIRIGDNVILSHREMGNVTNLEYQEEYVRMRIKDMCTCTEFSINKRKSNLIGVLPKG